MPHVGRKPLHRAGLIGMETRKSWKAPILIGMAFAASPIRRRVARNNST